ncbi:periplasmic nitrate reductase chaperone NapD [Balnearium lithotrophicum]|uniref:Periplasmic nitrate reductase chaperone NapD n=1 Tax=Balnearium lithotrophicum TaxID=223788 RepID=A0A521AN49_9BACT|nr:chaperone NapD [Balnearium lithotrophicum]SMO36212.1 periplasmic nitrate reductase chaperone NapD [Balnearium lithotrophicum]
MPIVSCVVTTTPEKGKEVETELLKIPGVEVYGGGLKEEENAYHIVVVLDALRYKDLEEMEKSIKGIDGVLQVAVIEAHFLDEFEKIEEGEIYPINPFRGLRKAEKEAERAWLGEDENGEKEEN